nr:M23 family metallopeptidase [Phosphitispora fastidiosa]
MAVLLAAILTCTAGYGSLAGEGSTLEKKGRDNRSLEAVSYTVKKGDCLWDLAQEYRVPVSLLAYANGLDPESFLYEGDRITIPEGDDITYTVNPGDTLWGISRKFGVSMAELADRNGTGTAELLLAGQKLVLPAVGPVIDVIGENVGIKIPLLDDWPVNGVVSSPFGMRNGRMHEGTDIAAELGSPIKAVAGGKVVFSGNRGDYGKAVIIDHGNGFRSLYGHAAILEVSAGDRVSQGDVIARVGSTGRSTGPHLHLELLYRGTPQNPERYLPD